MHTALLLLAALLAQPVAEPPKKEAPAPETKPAAEAPKPLPADWPFTSEKPEAVSSGYKFTEGPTWLPGPVKKNGHYQPGHFLFCDAWGGKVYAYDNVAKPVVLREKSGNAIGSAVCDSGNVYQVETEGRRITTFTVKAGDTLEATEAVEVASKLGDKKLDGMNDLTVRKADKSLYVTHGTWFLKPDTLEAKFSGVLRITPDGTTSKAAEGLEGPNGICFSPDGKTLYVNEYGKGRVNAFPVKDDGTLGEKKLLADLKAIAKDKDIKGRGGADGLHCDELGNIYTTGPAGIWVLKPDGTFIAHLPCRATNLCFGGDDMKTLLITTGSGVSKIGVKTPGAK